MYDLTIIIIIEWFNHWYKIESFDRVLCFRFENSILDFKISLNKNHYYYQIAKWHLLFEPVSMVANVRWPLFSVCVLHWFMIIWLYFISPLLFTNNIYVWYSILAKIHWNMHRWLHLMTVYSAECLLLCCMEFDHLLSKVSDSNDTVACICYGN